MNTVASRIDYYQKTLNSTKPMEYMLYSLVIVLVEAFPKHPLIALRQLMHFVGKLKVI